MLSIFIAAMLQLPAAQLAVSANRTTYHGRENQTQVSTPKLAAEIRVDGLLDEPVWSQAAVLTGFSQYQPVDGLPADDSTEVLVWYDEHNVYFGVRAYEAHGQPRTALADRDRTWSDDYIQILLDTFNDGRRAFAFGSNPLGVQSDGVVSEGSGCFDNGGGNGSCGLINTSPDYLYQTKGRITGYGYEIEMRIPFKSLRYQSPRVQDWGIQVIRQVQHSNHQLTWTPAKRGANSFLAQGGKLVGMTELKRGLVMDINPVVTSRADGLRTSRNAWAYDAGTPQVGGNARWGITSNLTLNGTVRPDFSQIESDASQAAFDPRQALFYQEKRPFFLEGSEIFNTQNNLIYTRRIVSPLAATKLAGKMGGTEVGFISAVDKSDYSFEPGDNNPVYNLLRVRRDVGDRSNVGFVYTDKIDGVNFNRVAAADARFVFGKIYSVQMQAAESFTHRNGETKNAPLWDVSFNRAGREFGLYMAARGWHPDFVASSGFLGRSNYSQITINPSHTVYNVAGGKIESWRRGIQLVSDADYSQVTTGSPGDVKLHLNSTMAFRSGWRFQQSIFIESFKYPPSLYHDYYVASGTDTVPFVGTPRIPNFDLFFTYSTPQFRKFDSNAWLCIGRDENFYEWAPAFIVTSQWNGNYRATDKLRLGASYIHQQFVRPNSRTTVATQQIPRLKMEYQLSRPIFVRVVTEYSSDRAANLRDDTRTGGQLLFKTDQGFVPLLKTQTNGMHVDWLFSYQPNPGTVIFAGYGSTMTEPGAFGFRNLERQSDGFFVKLSYLFRM